MEDIKHGQLFMSLSSETGQFEPLVYAKGMLIFGDYRLPTEEEMHAFMHGKKQPRTRDEILKALIELQDATDAEGAYSEANDLLLELINDVEIEKAYKVINKWYA